MPIARIITHSAADALPVVEQLRARGFIVQTVSPSETCSSPVDLEIVLEKIRPDVALSRTASLVNDTDADVYIAAGSFGSHRKLDSEPVSARQSMAVPTIEDTVNGVAAGLQNKRDLLAKALWEQRANMREARRLQRERVRQEQAARAVAQAERLRIEEAERISALERADSDRQKFAHEPPPLHAGSLAVDAAGTGHDLPQQEGVDLIHEPAEVQDSVPFINPINAKVEATVIPQDPAWKDQPVSPSASASGEGHRNLGEPTHIARRKATSGRPVVSAGTASPMRRARAKEWRAAVIVGSVFAILLMLAWRLATRGPVSPLPAAITNQSELQQEIPFGGVTLPGLNEAEPTASVPAGAGTVRPAAARFSSGDSAGRSPGGSNDASGAQKVDELELRKRSTKQASRQPRSSEPDDLAEDEVVIRHFRRNAPTPEEASLHNSGLKRFSDLDKQSTEPKRISDLD
ncbi:MAG TPA: hypothetical protein VD837_01940 [Terriglobales bacterium]|nr:hypothetical protein [Terriglobales bacterium]